MFTLDEEPQDKQEQTKTDHMNNLTFQYYFSPYLVLFYYSVGLVFYIGLKPSLSFQS